MTPPNANENNLATTDPFLLVQKKERKNRKQTKAAWPLAIINTIKKQPLSRFIDSGTKADGRPPWFWLRSWLNRSGLAGKVERNGSKEK